MSRKRLDEEIDPAAVSLTALLLMLAIALLAHAVCAQDARPSSRLEAEGSNRRPVEESALPRPSTGPLYRKLALAVAKVSANEGALWNLRDTALVWQVVEANGGRTSAQRLEFLARHSPRVMQRRACLRGNCQWSQHLDRKGTLPATLAAGGSVTPDYWRVELLPRWQAVQKLALDLVTGRVVDKPCPVTPRTWGGKMDRQSAARDGLYPIGCEGVLNDGFAYVRAEGNT